MTGDPVLLAVFVTDGVKLGINVGVRDLLMETDGVLLLDTSIPEIVRDDVLLAVAPDFVTDGVRLAVTVDVRDLLMVMDGDGAIPEMVPDDVLLAVAVMDADLLGVMLGVRSSPAGTLTAAPVAS
jgi:hypothetical protein